MATKSMKMLSHEATAGHGRPQFCAESVVSGRERSRAMPRFSSRGVTIGGSLPAALLCALAMSACTAPVDGVELQEPDACPSPVADAGVPDADAQEPASDASDSAPTDAASVPDDDGVDASWCRDGADLAKRVDLLDDGTAVMLVSGDASGTYLAGEWQARDDDSTVIALHTGEAIRMGADGRAQYLTGEVEQWVPCADDSRFSLPDLYGLDDVAGEWCAGGLRFEMRLDRVALRVDGAGSWTGSVDIAPVSGRVTVRASGLDELGESIGEREWSYAYDSEADTLASDSDGVVRRCET